MAILRDIETDDGLSIADIVNEDDDFSQIETELYSATNTLTFSYPIYGVNYSAIVEDALVRYPVNYGVGFDVYKVSSVKHQPGLDVIEVIADHWTMDYMYDLIPTITYKDNMTIKDVLDSVFSTVSGLNIINNLTNNNGVVYEPTFNSLFSDDQTLGAFLVGQQSPAFKYLDVLVERTLDGLVLHNRSVKNRKKDVRYIEDSPIVEGVNLMDWSYETEVGRKYNVIAPSASTIPTLTTWGDEGRFGVLNGIGGTKYNNLNEIPVGYEVYFMYKGFPFIVKNVGGLISADSVYFFDGTPSQNRMEELITLKNNNKWYVVSITDGLFNVVNQSTGDTIFNETLDSSYLKAYSVQISGEVPLSVSLTEMGVETNVIDLRAFFKPEEFEEFTINYLTIPKSKGFLQVETVLDPTKPSRATHFEDFVMSEGDEFEYFKWCKDVLPNLMLFVDERVNKEPRYKITAYRDDFDSIYGQDSLINQAKSKYKLGKLFSFQVESFGVNKEVSLSRVVFDGVADRFIEVEFGDLLESEVDLLPTKPNKQATYKGKSNYTIQQTKSSNGGGGNVSIPDEFKNIGDTLKEFEEFKLGLDEVYDTLPEAENLVNEGPSDLPTITPEYREDSGPKRVEWSNPILQYDPKLGRTIQQTKPILYNFTEAERKVAKIKARDEIVYNGINNMQQNAQNLIPKNPVFNLNFENRRWNTTDYFTGRAFEEHIQKVRDGLGYNTNVNKWNHWFNIDQGVFRWPINFITTLFLLNQGYGGVLSSRVDEVFLHELVDVGLVHKDFKDTPYYAYLKGMVGKTLQEIQNIQNSLGSSVDERIKKRLLGRIFQKTEFALGNLKLVSPESTEVWLQRYINNGTFANVAVKVRYKTDVKNREGWYQVKSYEHVILENIEVNTDSSAFHYPRVEGKTSCASLKFEWDPSVSLATVKNAKINDLLVVYAPGGKYETADGNETQVGKAQEELDFKLNMYMNNLTQAQRDLFVYQKPSDNPLVNKLLSVSSGNKGVVANSKYQYNQAMIQFLVGISRSGVDQNIAKELTSLNNAAYIQNR